jgi:hypothetical protein
MDLKLGSIFNETARYCVNGAQWPKPAKQASFQIWYYHRYSDL